MSDNSTKMDYRALPNSLAAMQGVDAMRFVIASSGQPDPLAGKAITGARADMILAQQQETQKSVQNQKIVEAAKTEFARGQIYRHKPSQKLVTIMASAGKGYYDVVVNKSGKKGRVNYKDLEEI